MHWQDGKWEDVFAFYAKEFALEMDAKATPKGTFNFVAPQRDRQYTAREITDIINKELLKQEIILIRGQQTATVVAASTSQSSQLSVTGGVTDPNTTAGSGSQTGDAAV